MSKDKASKRELNKNMKYLSLLKSAFDLFIKKGFDNTSIDEITQNAKVAKGTFYLYFKDKSNIKNTLIIEKSSEVIEKAFSNIKTNIYDTIDDRIIDFCDNIINILNEDRALLKLIYKNISSSLYSEVTEEIRKDTFITKLIVESMEELKDRYSKEEFIINLFLILEMVSAALYSSIFYEEPLKIEELKPYIYKAIRKIIA